MTELMQARPFAEDTLDDLWRNRQEAKAEKDRAASAQKAADDELRRRFVEGDATRLLLSNGRAIDLVATQGQAAYTSEGIKRLGDYLLERTAMKLEEWNIIVQWVPKVNGTRIRGLRKLGKEVVELIDNARMGSIGTPSLEGPKLEEL